MDHGLSEPFEVVVIDYGIGNIRSVVRMLEAGGIKAHAINDPSQLSHSSRIVLPGVGAFDAGMRALEDGGWLEPLNFAAKEMRKPTLGICLGMQLLCSKSEEGERPGLGWIDAEVVKVDTGTEVSLKIPHMGWTLTEPCRPSELFPDLTEELRYYYVHKYRVLCNNRSDVLAVASYGSYFDCAINHENIYGVQFHPEKSHRFGLNLLRRFATIPC